MPTGSGTCRVSSIRSIRMAGWGVYQEHAGHPQHPSPHTIPIPAPSARDDVLRPSLMTQNDCILHSRWFASIDGSEPRTALLSRFQSWKNARSECRRVPSGKNRSLRMRQNHFCPKEKHVPLIQAPQVCHRQWPNAEGPSGSALPRVSPLRQRGRPSSKICGVITPPLEPALSNSSGKLFQGP